MNVSHIIGLITKHFRRRAGHDSVESPMRDWLTLLICGTIALAGIIVWNAWAFDTVANGGTIGSSATSTPAVFDKSSLDAIHNVFVNRAAEEAKYRTGVYRYADPSQ